MPRGRGWQLIKPVIFATYLIGPENDKSRLLAIMNNLKIITEPNSTPISFSYEKCMGLIGNSIQITCAKYFLAKMLGPPPNDIKFVDLFAGIGGFHLTLNGYGKCALASDNNKNCQIVYQLNFPNTPFLLGDINDKEIQKKIIAIDFDLLCAGFPCQPYSKANTAKNKKDTVIGSLLEVIRQKTPQYLFLENVPQLVKYPIWTEIKEKLENWGYQLYWEKINPLDLGIPMNRPRVFIWGWRN